MADFTDPKPGRKHKAEERFKFRVGNRRKEYLHFFPGRDKGQIRVKLPHGEPGGIPGLMENKHGKETQLGDTGVYGTVGEGTLLLQPADILPEFLPGNVFWLFAEDSLKVIQIRADVSGIRFYSMVSKTPERKHLPVNFEIVHDGTSLKECNLINERKVLSRGWSWKKIKYVVVEFENPW